MNWLLILLFVNENKFTRKLSHKLIKDDNWQQEIKEIVSGASGGFLFGVPLLYAMEV